MFTFPIRFSYGRQMSQESVSFVTTSSFKPWFRRITSLTVITDSLIIFTENIQLVMQLSEEFKFVYSSFSGGEPKETIRTFSNKRVGICLHKFYQKTLDFEYHDGTVFFFNNLRFHNERVYNFNKLKLRNLNTPIN